MDENGECPIIAFDHEQFIDPSQLEEEEGVFVYHTFEEALTAKR